MSIYGIYGIGKFAALERGLHFEKIRILWTNTYDACYRRLWDEGKR